MAASGSERVAVEKCKGINGLDKVVLREPRGSTAEVYLYGAHVTSWKNDHGQYTNLQRQFVEAFQYAFLNLEVMVPLSNMDLPGMGFGALTLTHLHFPQIRSPLLI